MITAKVIWSLDLWLFFPERVQDCYAKFVLIGKQLTISAPTDITWAGSWLLCTRHCFFNVTCNAFSFDTVSGMCYLAIDVTTVFHPAFSAYEKALNNNCWAARRRGCLTPTLCHLLFVCRTNYHYLINGDLFYFFHGHINNCAYYKRAPLLYII